MKPTYIFKILPIRLIKFKKKIKNLKDSFLKQTKILKRQKMKTIKNTLKIQKLKMLKRLLIPKKLKQILKNRVDLLNLVKMMLKLNLLLRKKLEMMPKKLPKQKKKRTRKKIPLLVLKKRKRR